jgi:hypothetical protein
MTVDVRSRPGSTNTVGGDWSSKYMVVVVIWWRSGGVDLVVDFGFNSPPEAQL